MDLQKALQDGINAVGKVNYTNLSVKLASPPKLKVRNCFCLWSDLLGFGNQFYNNNWNLDEGDWKRVRDRLLKAHTVAMANSNPRERLLILNDGIAKTYTPYHNQYDNQLFQLSMFFREVVLIHQNICSEELSNGYYGCRSVVAFGQNAAYIESEIKLDDYYLNYSKPNPEGMSDSARRAGNPTIIYNPSELQMNTAFSKAYILENIGSNGGLKGPYIFIDNSAIQELKNLANVLGYEYIWEEKDDCIEFLVPRKDSQREDVVIGFRLSKPISPKGLKWSTELYRLIRFYPWDELTTNFWFDLDNEIGYGPN